jgi:hypothetical protein
MPIHPSTGKQLLQEEFIQKNPEWVKELELMLKMKKKAEIQVRPLLLPPPSCCF